MEKFVHRANLERLRRLLSETEDDAQSEKLRKLIAEEEAKGRRLPKSKD